MATAASSPGYDSKEYFTLFECGILAPDDRVELLEGLIVAMPPPSPYHNAAVHHVQSFLQAKLPPGTLVRAQMTFLAGPKSVPEPDIAIVPGRNADYLRRHPAKVHLLVEVAESSLPQDRLTKAEIYARAGVPAYWIVNLPERSVECFTEPDQIGGRFTEMLRATGSDRLNLPAFPEAVIVADDLFPRED